MNPKGIEQGTIKNIAAVMLEQSEYLPIVIDAFLKERQAVNVSVGTLKFYKKYLVKFMVYCEAQQVKSIRQVDANLIRAYIIWLQERGHNPGGVHAHYRAIRAMFKWYWEEYEPDFVNPMNKVKAPKLVEVYLPPANENDIQKMLDVANVRDKALMLFMLDTGCRAAEVLNVKLEDLNIADGSVIVKQGKGRKSRTVFIGKVTKRALHKYLLTRDDNSPYLWITEDGSPLSYWGLRDVLSRTAKKAGVNAPTAHAFRRAFASQLIKNDVDLLTIQRLMGHSDLSVLQRYAKQTNADLQAKYSAVAPSEHLK